MKSVLAVRRHGRVLQLTLDRPEVKNAFDTVLYDAVRDELLAAADDDGIAVVIVTGEGSNFSAGHDLVEAGQFPVLASGDGHGPIPFLQAVEAFPKPLIAAVDGVAIGTGFTMLGHCDLVLVGERARLRAPFVALGITCEMGSSVLLPALVGWQEAAHILYTSAWVDADRAVATGLAWRKVASADLLDEALELAGEIAEMPIASLVATKQLLLDGRREAVARARAREERLIDELRGGPANLEALAAFRERRKPDFTALLVDTTGEARQ